MNKEQQPKHPSFADGISEFLFRWRKWILIAVLAIILAISAAGVYAAISHQAGQDRAVLVYNLRKSFTAWQEAHPEDLLTAAKNLEQGEDSLDIDEETKKRAEETEADLQKQLKEALDSSKKNVQAWAYWIQALKARHLKEQKDLQQILEQLVDLQDETFYKIATLHLARVLYSEGQQDQAVAKWRELADMEDLAAEQLVASVYLGNYFARSGQKEDAIHYWEQVKSLGDEMLQKNGLDDEESFLGGENLITGNFRSNWKQWTAMADNQLFFLQSDTIQAAPDSYDDSVAIVGEDQGEDQAELGTEGTASQSVSFDTAELGIGDDSLSGLPGNLDVSAVDFPEETEE